MYSTGFFQHTISISCIWSTPFQLPLFESITAEWCMLVIGCWFAQLVKASPYVEITDNSVKAKSKSYNPLSFRSPDGVSWSIRGDRSDRDTIEWPKPVAVTFRGTFHQGFFRIIMPFESVHCLLKTLSIITNTNKGVILPKISHSYSEVFVFSVTLR